MVNEVLFWVIAAMTVLPALSLLFARKAVHIAMSVVTVMVGLAIAYVALGAPFLGVVQIVVYTGAVMMLFLFVLMLVGVARREDLKETLLGQRWIALFASGGIAALLFSALGRITIEVPETTPTGDPEPIALVLFDRYVIVMEVLGVLLITAAVGALVLTYTPRLLPRERQLERQAARIAGGAIPVNRPMPGVYARRNALDVPALDPDGNPIEASVSRVLEVRDQTRDAEEFNERLASAHNPDDYATPHGAPPPEADDRRDPAVDRDERKGEE